MELEELCKEVIELSKKVGAFIGGEQLKLKEEMIEVKSPNSLVTYVDKTAERQIIEKLSELLPESGFIAEEGTSDKTGKTFNWIIDPLDGTTNFIHGIPVYSVSIALQQRDEIVLGVVYEINQAECFYAWKGSPAFLNGKKINVSKNDNFSDAMLATGFPYEDCSYMNGYFDLFQDLMGNCRSIRRLGSAAVDLAYVACGRFDAFYECSLNPWDVAAGALIVQQAGGTVSDFKDGNNYLNGGEIIASNRSIHAPLIEKVQKYCRS